MKELMENNIEVEKKPRYRLMITRHSEGSPSGELSPEGVQHAKEKGRVMEDAEVFKSYASDHPSKRTFDTAENIGKESDIKSPLTGERYKTRTVKGIQYDIWNPDLSYIIPEAKMVIEEATLNEIAEKNIELWNLINEAAKKNGKEIISKIDSNGKPMIDIEKLPKDIQKDIAKIRQKNQILGFRKLLEKPEVTRRTATGIAHQLVEKLGILKEYVEKRNKNDKPVKGDVILNINTHGTFVEALLREAGIFVKNNGEEIYGIEDFENEEFGGYIQPLESIYIEIDDPAIIQGRIKVTFEGKRIVRGTIFLNRKKLEELNNEYRDNNVN